MIVVFKRKSNLTSGPALTGFTFEVTLNPSEFEACDREVSNPPDWWVKNVATLIDYLLTTEVDHFKLRYNL